MANKFKKYVFYWGIFGCFSLGIFGLVSEQVNAAEVIDQQQTSYNDAIGASPIGQTFVPAANNITKINLQTCQAGTSGTGTIRLSLCMGVPDYVTNDNNINCQGSGQTLIANASKNITCGGSFVEFNDIEFNQSLPLFAGYNYFFTVEYSGTGAIVKGRSTNGYSSGIAFSPSGALTTKDLFFKTYYEDSGLNTPQINIVSPLVNQTYADNAITFVGSTTHSTEISIFWGPLNASPANNIYGASTLPNNILNWNFTTQIPNGTWQLTYIAKNGTTTVTSTSSIAIANINSNIAEPISSSTMSTTSALNVLKNTNNECGSSAPAFINDPYTFWASNSPAILSNGSSSASSTPAFYSLITGGLYALMKTPIDMANKAHCYLSSSQAMQKGQAAGISISYLASITSGVNTLLGFPLTTIVLIWGTGIVLWFARKLLPFGK